MECISRPSRKRSWRRSPPKARTDAEHWVKDAALRLILEDNALPAIPSGSVLAEMRALRARIKPDPEGWTTRDYVQYGRR